MSSSYYKMFKVPMWLTIQQNDEDKVNAVLDWCKSKGALHQPWPANSYKKAIQGYASKGWKEYLKEGSNLPPQLVMMSAVEHTKNSISITSQLVFTNPVHRLNRVIKSDADYARIYNELLQAQQPIVLSQIFQIAERSHKEKGNYMLWVTEEPAPRNLLSILAERVITVGESEDSDINIKEVEIDDLPDFLEDQFTELLK
jgi:hypothetical protein